MKIQVNQNGLVRNLSVVFANDLKVIGEMIQNARRAGATQVSFSIEGDRMVVEDNGHGIRSFDTLLTVAESSWDEEVVEKDAPYGMGFLASLFAAKYIKVESNGKVVELDSAVLINGGEVADPVGCDYAGGTRFTLTGLNIDASRTKNEIKDFAFGCSIPVFLNGELMAREFSIEHADFELEGFGKAIVGDPARGVDLIYVQDFLVFGNLIHSYGQRNVLHLNPTFKARMPDRDCLVNQREVIEQINAAWKKQVNLAHLKRLIEERDHSSLSAWTFSKDEKVFAIENGYIPKHFVSHDFDIYTIDDETYGEPYGNVCSRLGVFVDELPQYTVVSYDFILGIADKNDARTYHVQNRLEYLRKIQAANPDMKLLYVFREGCKPLDDAAIDLDLSVEIVGEFARENAYQFIQMESYPLADIGVDIVMAEALVMKSQLGEVVICKDSGLLCLPESEDGRGLMVYTAEKAHADFVIQSLGNYWYNDNEVWDYTAYNEDVKDLTAWLNRHLGRTPIETLVEMSLSDIRQMLLQAGLNAGDSIVLTLKDTGEEYRSGEKKVELEIKAA